MATTSLVAGEHDLAGLGVAGLGDGVVHQADGADDLMGRLHSASITVHISHLANLLRAVSKVRGIANHELGLYTAERSHEAAMVQLALAISPPDLTPDTLPSSS